MNSTKKIVLGLAMSLGIPLTSSALTVHTIGDSTMATYDETSDKRGWGQVLDQFFTENLNVNNRAKSGASSKSFYREAAYWTTVKQQIAAGDYVFIQFAHNDEKNGGADGDELIAEAEAAGQPTSGIDYRGTTPYGTYQEHLRKYIDETRALNATPVLVTPIVRKYFEGSGTISARGCHNLTTAGGENLDYVAAMKAVAVEKSVQLIDHTALTKELVESYGPDMATSMLYCSGDNTHTSATGAVMFARLVAQDMVRQGILAEYVNAEADLIVNPSEGNFGRVYAGTAVTKEFTLLAMDLNPVEGAVSLSADNGFLLSLAADGEFSASLSLPYTGGNLGMTKVYVRIVPEESGAVSGTLRVTAGAIEKTVPLTVECIKLVGGTPVSAFWSLDKTSTVTAVTEGPVSAADEIFAGMKVKNYATISDGWVDPAIDPATLTQRCTVESETWEGGEIDAVSTRYIQFAMTAGRGYTVNIDSIGLYVGIGGTNGIHYRIEYSLNRDFANEVVLKENLNPLKNMMETLSFQPIIELPSEQTLYIRIYPWFDSSKPATSKYICLRNLTVRGVAVTGGGSGCKENLSDAMTVYCVSDGSSVTANYTLKQDAEVAFRIMDMTGRTVATRTVGKKQAGTYAETWDLPSAGIYFCTMLCGGESRTVRFVK